MNLETKEKLNDILENINASLVGNKITLPNQKEHHTIYRNELLSFLHENRISYEHTIRYNKFSSFQFLIGLGSIVGGGLGFVFITTVFIVDLFFILMLLGWWLIYLSLTNFNLEVFIFTDPEHNDKSVG